MICCLVVDSHVTNVFLAVMDLAIGVVAKSLRETLA